jgi:alkanesulfonate monooxygenase SsuD/methylene tetrahydromethanopterin reductase-like flavin-dependent oxidoreductase (luciferase family)
MVRETVGGYWNRVEACGKDYNPNRLAVTQFIGVADNDAEAYRLYKEPAEYFFNRSLHVFPGFTDPPGYVTEASVRARYKSQVRATVRNKQAKHDLTWDEMVDNGYVVIGGPDTVREQLEAAAKDLNIGNMCAMLQFGNMSDELTRYNTKMFADKVAPDLRPMFGEWAHDWWPANA